MYEKYDTMSGTGSTYSINVTFLPSNWATTWKPPQNSKDWTTIVDCHGSGPPSGMRDFPCPSSSSSPCHHPYPLPSTWALHGTENNEVPHCVPMFPRLLTLISLTHMPQNYVQILVYNHKVHCISECISEFSASDLKFLYILIPKSSSRIVPKFLFSHQGPNFI